MKPHRAKKELSLLPLLFVAIALCIGGHFVLQATFQENKTVEYALAALPFSLFAVVLVAIRIASKAEQDESNE